MTPETSITDVATWLRSFPLLIGMAIVAGSVMLGIISFLAVTNAPASGWQRLWIALSFGAVSLVISWMWLRPWHLDRRLFRRNGSAEVVESGQQFEDA